MKWEYEPKTHHTMYALYAVAQHWVEAERMIERDAEEEVEKNAPNWMPDPDDDDAVGQYLAERGIARDLHDSVLIPMHRYSCLVMLFTTIERELLRLVEHLEKQNGPQKLSFKDIKGSRLAQIAKYCEVFHGLRLKDCPSYSSLTDMQKIRGCIVHCLGDVSLSTDKDYLTGLESKRKGFFACPGIEISLEPECLKQFLTEAWAFFTWIFKALNWPITGSYRGNKLEELFTKFST